MEVGQAVERIKTGLEIEGMGDLGDQIDTGNGKDAASVEKEIRIRKAFRGSRIMLPRVLHRCGKTDYRELDFETDILPTIDWDAFSWRNAKSFSLADSISWNLAAITLSSVTPSRVMSCAIASSRMRMPCQGLGTMSSMRRTSVGRSSFNSGTNSDFRALAPSPNRSPSSMLTANVVRCALS
ncbi:MAG: hypothetical protein ACREHV_07690 [Rhizomicrobium sp.]